MARAKVSNNAITTLAAAIGSTDTAFNVSTGGGALFPPLSAGEYFYATLLDASNIPEIVKVTARSTDSFTISRGQDGTSARAFATGAVVALNVIAANLNELAEAGANSSITSLSGLTTPLSVAQGGTGANTLTAGAILKGAGTGPIAAAVDADIVATLGSTPVNASLNSANLGGVAASNYAQMAVTNVFTKAQRGAYSVLTDGATITIDLSLANQYRVQLGGNRTLGLPTNPVPGQSGVIDVYQDNTGSRTLSYAWCWQFPYGAAPVLSTAARAKDKIAYSVDVYQQSSVTISIASPGVVNYPGHGLNAGQQIQLVTTGGLPTGLVTNTTYFVVPIDANNFSLAATQTGAAIATSGSQAGVHTLTAFSITAALVRGIA